MNSPSHAFRRWFGSGTRSHRALAWTVLAILSALIPTLVTFYWPGVHDAIFGSPSPIQLHVESDKVRLAEMGLPQSEPAYIIPATVGPVHFPSGEDTSHDECGDLATWAPRAGGVDTSTMLRITLTGMRETSVVVNGLRVRVVGRRPPVQGTKLVCPVGGPLDVQQIAIDLERPRQLSYREADLTPRNRPFAYELRKGETAVFLVRAETKDDVEWRLYLDLVAGDKAVTYDVNRLFHADRPYRTTGQCGTAITYTFLAGEWARGTARPFGCQ